MLKACPKCKKLSDVETRICTCGFWFIKTKLTQISPDFQPPGRRKLRRSIVKFSVLTGFAVFAGAVAAVLGGFTNFFQTFEKEESSFDDAPAAEKDISTAGRIPKGRLHGRVAAVDSGELITLLDSNNREYKVRLGGIDAPEPEQYFGPQSRENLAALILDKTVFVNLQRIDEGGVMVGKILLDNLNINLEQIRAGFARTEKNSASEEDRALYANAENTAKTTGAGLWANSAATVSEVSNEPVDPPGNETILNNKSTVNPPQTAGAAQGVKNAASKLQAESEISTSISAATPVSLPSPASIDDRSAQKTATNAENTASKALNKTVIATARCADGTLSYSASRSGACSNHGGVAGWLGGSNASTPAKTSEKTYIRGLRGGCYYINRNGKKSYVDQSLCN